MHRGALFTFALVSLLGCGGDSGDTANGGGTLDDATAARYLGSAIVRIDYPGDFDDCERILPAFVAVGEPVSSQSVTENNPLHLSVGTTNAEASNPSVEGDFLTLSALVAQVDLGPTPVMLQYWTLNVSGSDVFGTLTDTHLTERLAFNQMWTQHMIAGDVYTTGIYPFILDRNRCTLSGTLSPTQATIHIEGQVSSADFWTDVARGFTIDVVAER